MRYFYANAVIRGDAELLGRIDAAAKILHQKLERVDLKALGISEYNQRYLGSKLLNLIGELQTYTFLLSLALDGEKSLDNFVFVDYGGGSGVMSLLAKELGVGRVIYNDIYDVSCTDAALLAKAIGVLIDDYVCGDIEALIDFVDTRHYSVNAICSYDVIEHIYDIDAYLRRIPTFSKGQPFRIVFGSGANIRNPVIRRALERAHLRYEREDRRKEFGHKNRDALEGFLAIRKQIVVAHAPELPEAVHGQLAAATRGLMKPDIEATVDEYRSTGRVSYHPDHPTNTCDPWTGNWQEHLMKTARLELILREAAIHVEVLPGYWAYSERTERRLVKSALNFCINWSGGAGLTMAPYFVLCADYAVAAA